jgi:hypothetical protein
MNIMNKFSNLGGIHIEVKNNLEKEPEKTGIEDLYTFYDEIKTAQYKAVYLISLRFWQDGKQLLDKVVPALRKEPNRVNYGTQILRIYEKAQKKEIIEMLRQNITREEIEVINTLLRLLEPMSIAKNNIGLM